MGKKMQKGRRRSQLTGVEKPSSEEGTKWFTPACGKCIDEPIPELPRPPTNKMPTDKYPLERLGNREKLGKYAGEY